MGAFRPHEHDREYRDLDTLDADFAHMAANGINAVRIPHTMPPRALLDLAAEHGLRVMVGLSAEQYVGFLIDRKGAPDVAEVVRAKVRACAGHPALLCYDAVCPADGDCSPSRSPAGSAAACSSAATTPPRAGDGHQRHRGPGDRHHPGAALARHGHRGRGGGDGVCPNLNTRPPAPPRSPA